MKWSERKINTALETAKKELAETWLEIYRIQSQCDEDIERKRRIANQEISEMKVWRAITLLREVGAEIKFPQTK